MINDKPRVFEEKSFARTLRLRAEQLVEDSVNQMRRYSCRDLRIIRLVLG